MNIFGIWLAPSIYENIDVKKGILLQLFGGTRKDFENTGRGKFRLWLFTIYDYLFILFLVICFDYSSTVAYNS